MPSTQEVARAAFLERGRPVLVTAQRQVAGRGRTGAGWIHAPRAVAASLAFDVSWPSGQLGPLALVAGLAARTALAAQAVTVSLKWPNDLLDRADLKVGGILTEVADGIVVVGLGVNIFFPDAPHGIAAICSEDPGESLAAEVANSWADELLTAAEAGPGWDRQAYLAASSIIGRAITWSDGGSGKAVDVAPNGALVVVAEGRRIELRSGEVRLVRRANLAADDPDATQGDPGK